ncbi:6-phospho-3-hexuloisomerase [Cryobacterium sp. 1639]|uniref:6-phospho-3-hexuloisomerase n=1 Tax=Cryobacterium inferilacus TaxID=2866629 RepID=UPI001C739938|nr:6-phospho-3-hexuloisomerase [Cryobacterium sp. 1639]MBX0301167.1 6-phospho-3-hexuloisomerase [Cryobacterium sp. 1639]
MPTTDVSPTDSTVAAPADQGRAVISAVDLILAEHTGVAARRASSPDTAASLAVMAERLRAADRVFVLGAGRSGLALRMTAMRLMHLGLTVHVVGDVSTPAITATDALLVASGSGSTAGTVRAAETARSVGASVLVLTTAAESPLADLAAVSVVIPAAQKQDHGGTLSAQYSGALFEQAVMVIGDALFHTLWQASGATADELWPRHANLE